MSDAFNLQDFLKKHAVPSGAASVAGSQGAGSGPQYNELSELSERLFEGPNSSGPARQSNAAVGSRSSEDQIPNFIPTTRQLNQYQSLLSGFGIESELVGDNFLGECPFRDCPVQYAGKEPKFSMQVGTGLFQCLRCKVSGNAWTFIREIHALYLRSTTVHQLEDLLKLRKNAFSLSIAQEFQLAFNTAMQEWMIPTWGTGGIKEGIVNLHSWRTTYDDRTGAARRQLQAAPMFKQVPYGLHRFREAKQRAVAVLEGHWDYLAWLYILRTVGQDDEMDLLGSPGSGGISGLHIGKLSGRKVLLLHDNDPAGRELTESTIKRMAKHGVIPIALKTLDWPPETPPGFDISDVVTSLPAKLAKKKAT